MNKVLIIDDDKELCALMKKCIEQEKLSAVTVYNGIEGVRLIDENKDSYSLIILDVMLPDIDGFQILQKIRDTSNIPVLMLTAKSSEEDKVFGLRLGADDYLTKPFGINELLARVNSLIRRYTTLNPFTADIDSISLKDMVIDKLNRTVTVKDIPVLLTGKEFDLLLFLASNKGRVCSCMTKIKTICSNSCGLYRLARQDIFLANLLLYCLIPFVLCCLQP